MKKRIGPYELPYPPVALLRYPEIYQKDGRQLKPNQQAQFAGELLLEVVDERLGQLDQLAAEYPNAVYETTLDRDFVKLCEYWSKTMLTLVDALKNLLSKHLIYGLNLRDKRSSSLALRFAVANINAMFKWMVAFETQLVQFRPTDPELRRCNTLLHGITRPLFLEMRNLAQVLLAGSQLETAQLKITLELPPVTDEIISILKNHSPKIEFRSRYMHLPLTDMLLRTASYWFIWSRLFSFK